MYINSFHPMTSWKVNGKGYFKTHDDSILKAVQFFISVIYIFEYY